MFWEGESLLHIGWADSVKVARVRPATAGSGAQTDAKRSLQIVASFQMDYLIAVRIIPTYSSGKAHFGLFEGWGQRRRGLALAAIAHMVECEKGISVML